MQVPLDIRFHNLEPSEAVETAIRERAAKLDRLYDRLTSCRVAVEARHKQHRKGNAFTVNIHLGVPQGELNVTRAPEKSAQDYAHPDVYKALRDAFDAAERQLIDYKRQLSGDVKTPVDAPAMRAEVTELFPDEDHGFLRTATGTSLYFHRNSLMDGDFDQLQPGDAVHYIERTADTGPLAYKVWVSPPHTEF